MVAWSEVYNPQVSRIWWIIFNILCEEKVDPVVPNLNVVLWLKGTPVLVSERVEHLFFSIVTSATHAHHVNVSL